MLEKINRKRPNIVIFPKANRTVPRWKRILYSIVGAIPIVIILSLFLQPIFDISYDTLSIGFKVVGTERIAYTGHGFPFSFLSLGYVGNQLFSISFSIFSILVSVLLFAGIAYLFMSFAGYAENKQSEKERFKRISKYFIVLILLASILLPATSASISGMSLITDSEFSSGTNAMGIYLKTHQEAQTFTIKSITQLTQINFKLCRDMYWQAPDDDTISVFIGKSGVTGAFIQKIIISVGQLPANGANIPWTAIPLSSPINCNPGDQFTVVFILGNNHPAGHGYKILCRPQDALSGNMYPGGDEWGKGNPLTIPPSSSSWVKNSIPILWTLGPGFGSVWLDHFFQIRGYIPLVTPTISLTANPTTITAGGSSTLSWISTNANSIQINNGIGSVAVPSGTRTVTPSATTTYTAIATNSAGTSASSSITITVNAASNHAPTTPSKPTGNSSGVVSTSYPFSTLSTDSDKDKIQYRFDWGDGSQSDWSTLLDSGISVKMWHSWSAADSYSIKAMAKDAKGSTSEWSAIKTIDITESTTPPTETPPNIKSFVSNQDPVDPGHNFSLYWDVDYATSISINPGNHESYILPTGHITLSITLNTTFTLIAFGVGQATTTCTVHVTSGGSPLPTLTLTPSKTSVKSSEVFTLTWSSTNADTVTIDGGGVNTNGTVSGSSYVTLTKTTTFTGLATGPGGTVTSTITVDVTGGGGGGGDEFPWWLVVLVIILIFVIINLLYKQYKGDWIPYRYYGASILSWIKNSEPPEKPKSKTVTKKNTKVGNKSYYDYVIKYGDQTKYSRRNGKRTKRKKGGKRR